MELITCSKTKEVFVPEKDVLSPFFLLKEGDEKLQHFLHDVKSEGIAPWIQPAVGAIVVMII